MGFDKNKTLFVESKPSDVKVETEASKIEQVIKQNQGKASGLTGLKSSGVHEAGLTGRKSKENKKVYTFTIKPSVRKKLDELVEHDDDFDVYSASAYLSALIEQRYHEFLEK